MENTIVWFRQDLRLEDNEALIEASRNADQVVCLYVFDERSTQIGIPRLRFLRESVQSLRHALRTLGTELIVRVGKPEEVIYQMAVDTKSRWVYCNRERTHNEVSVQDRVEHNLWAIGRELRYSRGKMLYHTADLPFPVTYCPDAFANFKKEVESVVPIRDPLPVPIRIPPAPANIEPGDIPDITALTSSQSHLAFLCFEGGEIAGQKALQGESPICHELPLLQEGVVLSPWISLGCLSPKRVFRTFDSNTESDNRIRQNLIMRDYLRLMGKKYGDRIFYKSGITGRRMDFKKDIQAFESWKNGTTPIPLLNAAMHQLNLTGWIPDQLRKLLAAYLIKVLQLDWRLGASHFEYTLVDYDPCSNWVSWMNLAGVGPEYKDDRTIHYDQLWKKIDPEETYTQFWLSQNQPV